jgi:hypothetical protein
LRAVGWRCWAQAATVRQAYSTVALMLLLASIFSSGCGLVQESSARGVGQRFADALDGRSDMPIEDFLMPDADVYLQGGLHLSRKAFQDHLDNMRGGYEFFHRMSPVYATRGGAGWLLDLVHAANADVAAERTRSAQEATMWIETTIESGHIKKLWIVFTMDRVQSLLLSPALYSSNTAALGLPLPDRWADGTVAMVASAEAVDAEIGNSEPALTSIVAAPLTAVAAGLLVLRVLVSRRQRPAYLTDGPVGGRNYALLLAMRERRVRACEEAESARSVPV